MSCPNSLNTTEAMVCLFKLCVSAYINCIGLESGSNIKSRFACRVHLQLIDKPVAATLGDVSKIYLHHV